VRVLERKYIKVKSDETTAVGAPLRDPAFQRIWLGLSMNRFRVAALAILKSGTINAYSQFDAPLRLTQALQARRKTCQWKATTIRFSDFPWGRPVRASLRTGFQSRFRYRKLETRKVE
jgi:hypothetical protein